MKIRKSPLGRLKIKKIEHGNRASGTKKKLPGSRIGLFDSTRPKKCPLCSSDGGSVITRQDEKWTCKSCGHRWD